MRTLLLSFLTKQKGTLFSDLQCTAISSQRFSIISASDWSCFKWDRSKELRQS
jgi:hypothetical protein